MTIIPYPNLKSPRVQAITFNITNVTYHRCQICGARRTPSVEMAPRSSVRSQRPPVVTASRSQSQRWTTQIFRHASAAKLKCSVVSRLSIGLAPSSRREQHTILDLSFRAARVTNFTCITRTWTRYWCERHLGTASSAVECTRNWPGSAATTDTSLSSTSTPSKRKTTRSFSRVSTISSSSKTNIMVSKRNSSFLANTLATLTLSKSIRCVRCCRRSLWK